jgi:hypothetical protein
LTQLGPPVFAWYVPAAQLVHPLAPTPEYAPAAQTPQLDWAASGW